jgi:hypothetical protein
LVELVPSIFSSKLQPAVSIKVNGEYSGKSKDYDK